MIEDFINTLKQKLKTDLGYSVRRFYVDKFFFDKINIFKSGDKIIDMGGVKFGKRGIFDIGKYDLDVKYANLNKDKSPDYLCDISSVPVDDNYFDGVIISEVLEHVFDPVKVLKEAYRIMKPGGYIMICVPFMYHIHPDPEDYGRYTETYYQKVLSEIGFKNTETYKQGLFFSVLANMLKIWAYELAKFKKPENLFLRKLVREFVNKFQFYAIKLDERKFFKENKVFSSHTTGYGIICRK